MQKETAKRKRAKDLKVTDKSMETEKRVKRKSRKSERKKFFEGRAGI